MRVLALLMSFALFALPTFAQFQFFEHMFQNGHHEQAPQNAGSDSAWYMQNYENGMGSTVQSLDCH